MKQLTQNQLFALLNTNNVNLNDPEILIKIANTARYRAALLSPMSDAVVADVFGEQFQKEMAELHQNITTPSEVKSLTEKEFVKLNLSIDAGLSFITTLVNHGDEFSDGCIYCKSSKCVAFTRGESVCG